MKLGRVSQPCGGTEVNINGIIELQASWEHAYLQA